MSTGWVIKMQWFNWTVDESSMSAGSVITLMITLITLMLKTVCGSKLISSRDFSAKNTNLWRWTHSDISSYSTDTVATICALFKGTGSYFSAHHPSMLPHTSYVTYDTFIIINPAQFLCLCPNLNCDFLCELSVSAVWFCVFKWFHVSCWGFESIWNWKIKQIWWRNVAAQSKLSWK